MNTTTVNFRLSCEILRNFVVQNTPLGKIPLFCRSDYRFYRTRTAFTRILSEKVTFFLFIRKIGRFKYKSGDREICQEIGSLPIKSGGLEPLQKSCVDFNSTSFFKSEGFNVYCLVVSGIACSLEFFTCGSIFLALRQDRIHGLVNCGSLLRQPKRTFHYGFARHYTTYFLEITSRQ